VHVSQFTACADCNVIVVDKHTEIFHGGSRLQSKKTLSFDSAENFTVTLEYLESAQLPAGTLKHIATYEVSGVPTAEQYNFTGKPKVHSSCRLNSNGMVVLEKAEAEISLPVVSQTTTSNSTTLLHS
jgi:hypothetical protein